MDDKYNVVFQGNLVPGYTRDAVKKNLARIFKTSDANIAKLMSNPPCVIGKDLERQRAEKYRQALKKAGAVCLLERAGKPSVSASENQQKQPSKQTAPLAEKEKPSRSGTYDVVYDGKLFQGFDLYSVKQNLAKALQLDFKQVHELLSPRPAIINAGLQGAQAKKVRAMMKTAGARCRIVPHGSVAPGKSPDTVSDPDHMAAAFARRGIAPKPEPKTPAPPAPPRRPSPKPPEPIQVPPQGPSAKLPELPAEAILDEEVGQKRSAGGRKKVVLVSALALLVLVCIALAAASLLTPSKKPEPRAQAVAIKEVGSKIVRKKTPVKPAAQQAEKQKTERQKIERKHSATTTKNIPGTLEEAVAGKISKEGPEAATELDASFTTVNSLDALLHLPNLESLNLSSTNVSDISALADLPRLKRLDLSSTTVSDISPLAGLKDLEVLDLRQTPVEDLSPLKNLFRLRSLDLRGCKATYFTPLAGLSKLNIVGMKSSSIIDIKPVAVVEDEKCYELSGEKL